ncbi:MAG: TlpA family protein disulfide reductase [Epsilonproteobacteria bacterium]|nr:TlpA family protein disulfide reductase [Campylobacterota bacterium]
MIHKITAILLLLLLLGCSSNHETKETNSTTTEKKISSLFTLETIQGKTLHIDESEGGLTFHEFKNKVVIFVFFGYRCPPCLAEIPALTELNNQAHKDLEIVGLEVQGLNNTKLEDFAKRTGANYHLISGETNRAFIDYIIQKANWRGGIPFLLAFDKKGVVKVVHTGGVSKEQFEKIYADLSKPKEVSSK